MFAALRLLIGNLMLVVSFSQKSEISLSPIYDMLLNSLVAIKSLVSGTTFGLILAISLNNKTKTSDIEDS